MIIVTVFRKNGEVTGFLGRGHAGCGEEGQDIVCAAASALMINCVNSISQIAGDEVEDSAESGYLDCRFPKGLSAEGSVLFESMLLGLRMIAETSDAEGSPFLEVRFEED